MKHLFPLIFILTFCIYPVKAQDPNYFKISQSQINGKTVSFSELINEIRSAEQNIDIKDVKVRWNEASDRTFMDGRFLSKTEPETWKIKHWIKFENCDFDPDFWLLLRNMEFENYLSFFHCTNIKIMMNGCTFEEAVRVNSNDIEFLKFNDCTFKNGFKFNRSYVTDQLAFQHCKFSVKEQDPNQKIGLDMEHRIFVINNRVESLNLTVENSTFAVENKIANDPQYFIYLSNTTFNNLVFNRNVIHANIDFSASTIENLFMSYNCDFSRKIIVNALNLNSINTKVQWQSIDKGRLAVMDTAQVLHSGADAFKLKDEFISNQLISCYANFYAAYRSQGSRLSANACYVEWKDIETKYLGNIYRESDSFIPLFTYIMNRFLDIFCDYGTNPFQSIIISLYVIFGFAVIYYLYPSGLRMEEKDFYTNMKLIAQNYSQPLIWTRIRVKQILSESQPGSYEEYVSYMKKREQNGSCSI